MLGSASVFVCLKPGCIKTFVRFADLELHLDVGEHVVQDEPAVLEHNMYDKLKRDWVAMFATVQTEERQPQHYQPCTHSEESGPEANMGWALAKARSGSSQFSEKVKDYLTKKFDIGEKTGQKVSAEQVAKDMHNVRTHDNQRLFGREDWLTKLQVQGFFSRLAPARRKQGWYEADTSEEIDEGDKVGQQRRAVEEVIENLGLKHQIIFDVYNLCQYYHSNKLPSFNVSMLKHMCGYFKIPYKSRDLKRDLLAKVSELVKECECSRK